MSNNLLHNCKLSLFESINNMFDTKSLLSGLVRGKTHYILTCNCWPYRKTKIITILISSCSKCENPLGLRPIFRKTESIFSVIQMSQVYFWENIQLEIIFFLFSAPFCTLNIIVKMSIQGKSAMNENKFEPKGQRHVKSSEIISKCFKIIFKWRKMNLKLISWSMNLGHFVFEKMKLLVSKWVFQKNIHPK